MLLFFFIQNYRKKILTKITIGSKIRLRENRHVHRIATYEKAHSCALDCTPDSRRCLYRHDTAYRHTCCSLLCSGTTMESYTVHMHTLSYSADFRPDWLHSEHKTANPSIDLSRIFKTN